MRLMLGYLLTPLFHLHMFLMVLFFYPVQIVARHVWGEEARLKSVDWLNFSLLKGLQIMGAKVTFKGLEKIPGNRPVIVVANHQSLYDIPAIGWAFRKQKPKFIAKKELSKNLLSISYNLKHGKSALIDRSNGSQAVREIFKLGRRIEKKQEAACIFPEGTRSRTGELKPFMPAGIQTLLRAAPSAVIVPFVINGHSKLMKDGNFPLRFGQRISYQVLDPVEVEKSQIDHVPGLLHTMVANFLDHENHVKG